MEQRPGLAEQLIALGSAVAVAVIMMPPQERMWMALRTVGFAHRCAARLARLEGRAGMGDELQGRDPSPRYAGAVLAGWCRDRLARRLESMRP